MPIKQMKRYLNIQRLGYAHLVLPRVAIVKSFLAFSLVDKSALIINFEGREAKGLSKGRYDETFAGEDGLCLTVKVLRMLLRGNTQKSFKCERGPIFSLQI